MATHHLQILLAAQSPIGLVLRRGPSAWFHLILWHVATDEFESGAWFRGRIYEERCDLSPDGKLFLYFAHQGRKLGSDYTDSWTALSRPPWLHALTLWPEGSTYGGGGSFGTTRGGVTRLVLRTTAPPHGAHPSGKLKISYQGELERSATLIGPASSWRGVDSKGREIFIRKRAIFELSEGRERRIADFEQCAPDPKPPPRWALQLPRARNKSITKVRR